MEDLKVPRLTLTFPPGRLPGFSWLLQCGFVVRAGSCGSIRCFLLNEMNLSNDFIEQVIQSVFLDGKPVDNLDEAHVKDGCTLALSGAMPGLVGATMRKGGYYASLRSGISYRGDKVPDTAQGGLVTVKLFNLVASELESPLMKHGIWVPGDVLEEFIQSRPAEFWARCQAIVVDGLKITAEELKQRAWPKGPARFSAETSCGS